MRMHEYILQKDKYSEDDLKISADRHESEAGYLKN